VSAFDGALHGQRQATEVLGCGHGQAVVICACAAPDELAAPGAAQETTQRMEG
jgi:hypothetical protein